VDLSGGDVKAMAPKGKEKLDDSRQKGGNKLFGGSPEVRARGRVERIWHPPHEEREPKNHGRPLRRTIIFMRKPMGRPVIINTKARLRIG